MPKAIEINMNLMVLRFVKFIENEQRVNIQKQHSIFCVQLLNRNKWQVTWKCFRKKTSWILVLSADHVKSLASKKEKKNPVLASKTEKKTLTKKWVKTCSSERNWVQSMNEERVLVWSFLVTVPASQRVEESDQRS